MAHGYQGPRFEGRAAGRAVNDKQRRVSATPEERRLPAPPYATPTVARAVISPRPPVPRSGRSRGTGHRRSLRVAGRIAAGALSVLVLAGSGIAWSVTGGLLSGVGLHTSDALGDNAPKSSGG